MHDVNITQTHNVSFIRQHNARRIVQDTREEPKPPTPPGRLPRITKLMALAIRFEHLLAKGAVRNQAELADLGHVTRTRITQIMNLLHLAPKIQEEILNLPRTLKGRDPITERHLRDIVTEADWEKQRARWQPLRKTAATVF